MSSEHLTSRIVLGSRSPRRVELLSQLISRNSFEVVVAPDESEPEFDGCRILDEILIHLAGIARLKNERVWSILRADSSPLILTADTTVIAPANPPVVLGKPDGPDWQKRVRDWFCRFYFGRTHLVATAICLREPSGTLREAVVQTEVTFCDTDDQLLEWYLTTEDSLGKAGGYGIQSAGGIFVTEIQGSLSNVIGLPLKETFDFLQPWLTNPTHVH